MLIFERPKDLSTQACREVCTLEVFFTWFWGRPQILDFWGLGGPGGPKNTLQKVGGRSPPASGKVFGAAGAAQTQRIGDFRPAQKPCIKNQSVRYAGLICMDTPTSMPEKSGRSKTPVSSEGLAGPPDLLTVPVRFLKGPSNPQNGVCQMRAGPQKRGRRPHLFWPARI